MLFFRLPTCEVCQWGGGSHPPCAVDVQTVRNSLYQPETGSSKTGMGNIHPQISGNVFHWYPSVVPPSQPLLCIHYSVHRNQQNTSIHDVSFEFF